MPIIDQEEDDDKHQQLLPNAFETSPESQSVSTRKLHRTTLPTEIIIEVLLKLPVESILRCKSVCKSWRSLISDPYFISSHLNLSTNRRLIFKVGWSPILSTCCLNDVMNDIVINNDLEVIDYPFKYAGKPVRVVGSCNGLLCLYIEEYDIVSLLNPSTRESHTLPPDANRTHVLPVHFGFGYDDSTDDYKVVSVSLKPIYDSRMLETVVKIYSLRSEGWKVVGTFPHGNPYGFGKFSNGALHWAVANSDDHWKIISLDLATETFGEVMLPVFDEGEMKMTLGSLGEWLCVVCDYDQIRRGLWAMKVYGVKDSWTKLVSVSYMPDHPKINNLIRPLCNSNDGRILLTHGTKLMISDPKKSSVSEIHTFDEWVEASTFAESLVSPVPPAPALGHS